MPHRCPCCGASALCRLSPERLARLSVQEQLAIADQLMAVVRDITHRLAAEREADRRSPLFTGAVVVKGQQS